MARYEVNPDIRIKTPEQLAKMRVAGQLAAEVLTFIEPYVQPGITTGELDALCHNHIVHTQQAIPAPLNYKGFPKSICTSVNHQVCHGIPGNKKLKNGDIVNIDVTVLKDGVHGDTSKMFAVGQPSIQAERLMHVTYQAMMHGIGIVQPGATTGDIGYTIATFAHAHHYSVVESYCGHGIGEIFHEPELQILHFGEAGTGELLRPGMTFTIEPMLNVGKKAVKLLPDGWTVVTKDHSLSAQWEHTVAVTESGVEILTLRPEEHWPAKIAAV